jgi:para-aminobenzoate synthetase/4-amino-4-deoxychorismate lyase
VTPTEELRPPAADVQPGAAREEIGARFDDLGPDGLSFVLTGSIGEFVATGPAEVPQVIHAAEQAARQGYWVAGFVTYEAAAGLDPSMPVQDWPPGHPLAALPLAWFAVFSHREDVDRCRPTAAHGPRAGWWLDRSQGWHREAVERIHRDIVAGDYYQLNLTARMTGTIDDPFDVYTRLATAQAGRYNAFLTTAEHTIMSASPELFFRRDGDRIVTRPMKGTAPRGRWSEEDKANARSLCGSAKERAENIMIVDLLRNDLGRISETGSVTVPTLLEAERYPTVWQLTSTVAAQLRAGTALVDVFRSLFPSGSITGAPKHAAMHAIAEIERRPRGVYCGAVGYLRPDPVRPAAQFCVAIRTVTRSRSPHYAEYGTGGGITWSSAPDAEWAELLAKTIVLRKPPRRPRLLIETLRFEPPGTFVNHRRHLNRLLASADYFGFRHEPRAVQSALDTALDGRAGTARVRVRLDRNGQVGVDVTDFLPSPEVTRLAVAEQRIRSDDVLCYHKHGDREVYDRLRLSRPDADDVLMVNENGQVTEATTANLAVRLDGRWWTPRLDCGLLPGVERGRLLDAGVMTERTITVAELADATELALVSSLRGWRAARLATT